MLLDSQIMVEKLQTLGCKLGNANQHDGWYPMLSVSMILPKPSIHSLTMLSCYSNFSKSKSH
jgi:hypothetical protein